MRSPRLSFAILPHTTPASFQRLFKIAGQKWPGIKLGYVGTSGAGDHYMQEAGNSAPFIVTAAEFTNA